MWDWLDKIQQLKQQAHPFVLVTLTRSSGSAPRELGAKMIVEKNGEFYGTIGGGKLEELALEDSKKVLDQLENQSIKYPLGAKTGQCCGGTVELFFEVFNQGPRLVLFGAGHVGQAVCKTFSGTPFLISLIDERQEWIGSSEIPKEVTRHHGYWESFLEEISWCDKNTYVAIMTHQHDLDQQILENVLRQKTRYIGLIGSQSKWKRFQQRLIAKGFSEQELKQVRCPLGLPVGGKAPQEVAISLASELLRDYYGKEL